MERPRDSSPRAFLPFKLETREPAKREKRLTGELFGDDKAFMSGGGLYRADAGWRQIVSDPAGKNFHRARAGPMLATACFLQR
jgi:hypothetical protein